MSTLFVGLHLFAFIGPVLHRIFFTVTTYNFPPLPGRGQGYTERMGGGGVRPQGGVGRALECNNFKKEPPPPTPQKVQPSPPSYPYNDGVKVNLLLCDKCVRALVIEQSQCRFLALSVVQ